MFEKVRGEEGEEVRKGMEGLHRIEMDSRKDGQTAKAMEALGRV